MAAPVIPAVTSPSVSASGLPDYLGGTTALTPAPVFDPLDPNLPVTTNMWMDAKDGTVYTDAFGVYQIVDKGAQGTTWTQTDDAKKMAHNAIKGYIVSTTDNGLIETSASIDRTWVSGAFQVNYADIAYKYGVFVCWFSSIGTAGQAPYISVNVDTETLGLSWRSGGTVWSVDTPITDGEIIHFVLWWEGNDLKAKVNGETVLAQTTTETAHSPNSYPHVIGDTRAGITAIPVGQLLAGDGSMSSSLASYFIGFLQTKTENW